MRKRVRKLWDKVKEENERDLAKEGERQGEREWNTVRVGKRERGRRWVLRGEKKILKCSG